MQLGINSNYGKSIILTCEVINATWKFFICFERRRRTFKSFVSPVTSKSTNLNSTGHPVCRIKWNNKDKATWPCFWFEKVCNTCIIAWLNLVIKASELLRNFLVLSINYANTDPSQLKSIILQITLFWVSNLLKNGI